MLLQPISLRFPKLETFKWKSFSFTVIDERLCFRYLAFILFGTEGDYY